MPTYLVPADSPVPACLPARTTLPILCMYRVEYLQSSSPPCIPPFPRQATSSYGFLGLASNLLLLRAHPLIPRPPPPRATTKRRACRPLPPPAQPSPVRNRFSLRRYEDTSDDEGCRRRAHLISNLSMKWEIGLEVSN